MNPTHPHEENSKPADAPPPWTALLTFAAALLVPVLMVAGLAAVSWYLLDRGNLAGLVPLFMAWVLVVAFKGKS